jgi:RNA polymerase sigma-70 factor (ECF subfamily)
MPVSVDQAKSHDERFARSTEPFRRELMAHCYRMLGSVHDAEDLVQETYLRAWRGYEDFEGRSSLRTWLYRIATRACLNELDRADRRVLPSAIGAPSNDPAGPLGSAADEVAWLEPIPDAMIGDANDPASIVGRRETTRLAFIAALQHLPARQRAVLLLRDVLRWKASEVAALLDMSVAAVNSALQRAHAHLADVMPSPESADTAADVDREVLDRYVTAFINADMTGLAELLREDVRLEMPPIPDWFDGRRSVVAFLRARVIEPGRRKAVKTLANGQYTLASYVPDENEVFRAHTIQVLTLGGGLITRIDAFFDRSLFGMFGLPETYDAVQSS